MDSDEERVTGSSRKCCRFLDVITAAMKTAIRLPPQQNQHKSVKHLQVGLGFRGHTITISITTTITIVMTTSTMITTIVAMLLLSLL